MSPGFFKHHAGFRKQIFDLLGFGFDHRIELLEPFFILFGLGGPGGFPGAEGPDREAPEFGMGFSAVLRELLHMPDYRPGTVFVGNVVSDHLAGPTICELQ